MVNSPWIETETHPDGPGRVLTFGSLRRGATAPIAPELTCTHDLEGRILSINRAACETLGLSASTLEGMNIPDLLVAADDPGFAEYMRTIQRDGIANGTMTLLARNGTRRIWEYRNTLDRKSPTPIVRGVAYDVTEREETFRHLLHSEELFRSIVENASDLTAIVELDGKIRYVSPSVERVLGYPGKGLEGNRIITLVHPDDTARATGFLVRQIAKSSAIETAELRLQHLSGAWRSFEVVAKNLIKKGRTSAIVMSARDVTERKLLEAQLIQANRLASLGRLAATVAHEFNNVLMGMQPFVELIQRPGATQPTILKGAGHIANSIQRGKRIVLDILRYTQPHLPVTVSIDFGEWWERFSSEAEAVLGNAIALVAKIPVRGLHITADGQQLSQVLSNLVSNARDAMPAGGTLTIEARALEPNGTFPFGFVPNPETFVQISIRDTGQGMPGEVMDRIFEPLYTTRQNGTGLGLAVAHQVIAHHGGFVFVESEVGQGSTFHLFLPKAFPASRGDTVHTETVEVPAARRLLIIDDEPSIVDGITALLEQDGFAIDSISNGEEVAQALDRFHPEVVLLDYSLPGMDGSEVYARIREISPALPIIFATGHGDRRIVQERLNDSRTRFLQKPFEVSQLLEMITALDAGDTP